MRTEKKTAERKYAVLAQMLEEKMNEDGRYAWAVKVTGKESGSVHVITVEPDWTRRTDAQGEANTSMRLGAAAAFAAFHGGCCFADLENDQEHGAYVKLTILIQ